MKKCLINWFNGIRLMLNAIMAECFLAVACTGNYFSGISAEHRVLFMLLGIYGAIGVIVNFRNSDNFGRYEETRDWKYPADCDM